MAKKVKKRTVDEISATPEAKATRRAVRIAGGAVAVGNMVHPKRCEDAVRKWTEDPSRMTPEDARTLSKAIGFLVPVAQILPEVYGKLSVQELGYAPVDHAGQARK